MTINPRTTARSGSPRRDPRGAAPSIRRLPSQRALPPPDDVLPAVSGLGLGPRVAAVATAWAASLALSTTLAVRPALFDAALAVHLLSLVVGLGAVMLVEWHAVLWIVGKRSLHECSRLAAGASPLIWLGVAGLLSSGALLGPDLTHAPTQVKLALVLLLGVNGALLSSTRRALALRPAGETLRDLPPSLLRTMLALGVTSQATWWGAAVLGFLVAAGRL